MKNIEDIYLVRVLLHCASGTRERDQTSPHSCSDADCTYCTARAVQSASEREYGEVDLIILER